MKHRILSCSALIVGLAACGAETPVDGPTGHLELGLQSTGPDGATYEFADAVAEVQHSNFLGENYVVNVPLSGTDSVLEVTLPAGYDASVEVRDDEGPASASNSLTLTRTDADGSVSSVEGYLVAPTLPYEFTVESSGVHSLPLTLEVADVGDITFDAGQLEITLEVVNADASSPGQLSAEGPVGFSSTLFGDNASTLLRDQVSFETADDLDMDLAANLTTDFELTTQNRACAVGTVSTFTTTSSHAGWQSFFSELGPSAEVTVCVQNRPQGDRLSVAVSRDGVSATELDLPGTSYLWVNASVFLAAEVFDGVTLELSQIPQPVTLTSVVAYGSGSSGFMFQNFGSGEVSLTLSP